MLQLSENKRRRRAQIAKKFKNAFLDFSHFFSSPPSRETPQSFAAKHTAPAANWSFPPPGATVDSPPSACNVRYLSAGVGKR
jgi:hypothetical protein